MLAFPASLRFLFSRSYLREEGVPVAAVEVLPVELAEFAVPAVARQAARPPAVESRASPLEALTPSPLRRPTATVTHQP